MQKKTVKEKHVKSVFFFFIFHIVYSQAQVNISHEPTPYDSLFKTMNFSSNLFNEMESNPKEKEKYEIFLKEICKLYKKPVTTEDISCKEYKLNRIIICGEKTEIFENRIWTWGGIFYFYNTVFAVNEDKYYDKSAKSISDAIAFHKINPR